MDFKTMVEDDIHQTFIDVDIFGELHMVEYAEISIVIDDDALKEKQKGQDLAVAGSDLLFYAKSSDLPAKRPAGELINIDGMEYAIDDWSEDMGMASIMVSKNITA